MDSRTGLITKPITEDTSFDPNNPIVNQSSALQVDDGLGGEIAKGLSRGIDTFQQGLYKAAELAGDATGIKSLSNFGAEGAAAQEQQLADAAAKVSSYTEVDSLDDAVNFLVGGAAEVFPQAVASLLGYSTAGVAAKLLGTSSKVAGRVGALASAVPSTVSETGNLYGEIENRTGNKDAVAAIGGGLAIGALEALPILDLVGGKNAGRSIIGSAIKQGGRTAVAEGTTEGLQEIVGQEAVKYSDPNYQYADGERLDNFINAGILGAVGGGVLGGTTAGVGRLLNPDRTITPDVQESNPFDTQNSPVANALAPEDLLNSPEAQEATQIFNSLRGVDNFTVNEGLDKLLKLKDRTEDPVIKSEIDRMVSSVVDTYSQQENTITSPGEQVLNSDIGYEQANTFEELQNILGNEDFNILSDEVIDDIDQEASNQRGRDGSISEQPSALDVNSDRGVNRALRIAEQEPANIPTLTFEDLTDKNNPTYSVLQSEETNKHRLSFARSKENYDRAKAQTIDVTIPGSNKVQKLNLVNLTNRILKDRNIPIDENLSDYVKERGLNSQGVRAIQAAMQGISAFMNIDTSAYKTSKGKAITKDLQGNDIQLDPEFVDFRIEDIPDSTIFSITPEGEALRWGDYKIFTNPKLKEILADSEELNTLQALASEYEKHSTLPPKEYADYKKIKKRINRLEASNIPARLEQVIPVNTAKEDRKALEAARKKYKKMLENSNEFSAEEMFAAEKDIRDLENKTAKNMQSLPESTGYYGDESTDNVALTEQLKQSEIPRTPPFGGKVASNETDLRVVSSQLGKKEKYYPAKDSIKTAAKENKKPDIRSSIDSLSIGGVKNIENEIDLIEKRNAATRKRIKNRKERANLKDEQDYLIEELKKAFKDKIRKLVHQGLNKSDTEKLKNLGSASVEDLRSLEDKFNKIVKASSEVKGLKKEYIENIPKVEKRAKSILSKIKKELSLRRQSKNTNIDKYATTKLDQKNKPNPFIANSNVQTLEKELTEDKKKVLGNRNGGQTLSKTSVKTAPDELGYRRRKSFKRTKRLPPKGSRVNKKKSFREVQDSFIINSSTATLEKRLAELRRIEKEAAENHDINDDGQISYIPYESRFMRDIAHELDNRKGLNVKYVKQNSTKTKPESKKDKEVIPKRLPEGSFFTREGDQLHPVKGIAYFAIKKGNAVIYVHKVRGGWKASERTSGTSIGKVYKTKKETVKEIQERIKRIPESKLNALVKKWTSKLSNTKTSSQPNKKKEVKTPEKEIKKTVRISGIPITFTSIPEDSTKPLAVNTSSGIKLQRNLTAKKVLNYLSQVEAKGKLTNVIKVKSLVREEFNKKYGEDFNSIVQTMSNATVRKFLLLHEYRHSQQINKRPSRRAFVEEYQKNPVKFELDANEFALKQLGLLPTPTKSLKTVSKSEKQPSNTTAKRYNKSSQQKKAKTDSKNTEKGKTAKKVSKPEKRVVSESRTATQEETGTTLEEAANQSKKSNTKTSETHIEEVTTIADSLFQKLGLKVNYKVTDKVTTANIPRGRVTTLKDGSFELFINPELTGELREEIISHEVGHMIFRTVLSNQKSAYAKAILADFVKWQEKFGGKNVKGIDIIKSKQTPKRVLDALLSATDAEATLESMGESSANYLLDFEEWFADRVGMWVHNEKIAPKGPVDKFFKEIGRLIRRLFNLQKSGESVDDFLDMLVRRTDTQRDGFTKFNMSAVQKALTKEDREELKKAGFGAILSKTATPEMLAALAIENAKNPTSKVNNILLRQFIKEGMSTSTANILRRAAMSTYIRNQLLKNVEAKYHRLYDDPDFAAAAAYQMWLSGDLKIGPKTETVFNRLVELLYTVLGIVSDSKGMEKIFEAVRSGEISLNADNKRFHIERTVSGGIAETVDRYFGSLWDSAANLSNKLLTSADTRLRKTRIPALIELADKLHTEAGAIGKDVTYSQGKLEASGRFESKVNSIFKDLSKEDSSIIIEVLNNPKLYGKASKSVRTAVDKIRVVMKELRDYMVSNGLELGDKGETYFPWVADIDYLIANQNAFLALVSQDKFKPELEKLRKFFSYKTDEKGNPILPSIEKIPGLLFDHFRGENGFMDSVPRDVTDTPNNRFMNVRILSFITEKGNDEDFARLSAFLSKDVGTTLYNYIHAATKRAEYARVFGADEAKLRALYSKALNQGASIEDMKLAYDYVHAISGTLGRDTALWLSNSFIGKKLNIVPESGRPINTKLQNVMSSIMVYQNLRVLTLATLSSLVDPLGIAVRSNSILPVFNGLKNSLLEVLSKDKSELRELSESLGVISDSMTNDALGWEYGGAYMSSGVRQINDTFFKYIGLQGLTKQTRIMAVSGGLEFLKKHATKPNKHSTRYLNELSVSKSDIKIDKDGKVKLLSMPERKALEDKGTDKAKEELARDDRVRQALVQFVDESILRPNPSQRPLWASDPHFMLIFHLKSFMYAFHDRILMRVASELKHGNMGVLLHLGMYIPVMLASLFIRDLIKFGEEAPWKENWSFWDFVVDAAYKTGIPGIGSLLANDVANDSKFGNIPGISLLGPTASQIANPDLDKALPFQQLF